MDTRADFRDSMAQVLIAGSWRDPQVGASTQSVAWFRALNPGTGEPVGETFPVSTAAELELALAAATQAAEALAATTPETIAAFLETYAAAIDADRDVLVALAHAETGLPISPRLAEVELPRTSGQLRQAAQAVRSRAWTQPVIDTRTGLRAHFAPLQKPVLVFGPNNFPFAFNAVAGSDFASAIAARNPVIAKAHPAHPATSKRLATLAHAAAIACGLPAASIQMFYATDPAVGLQLAGDRRLGAIAFTGSRKGGLALKAAADAAGIPIHAEMSSVNPVVLLPGALQERGAALAQAFFASCTLGSGQFCTNPGLVLVADDAAGDAFVASAASLFEASPALVLLSQDVRQQLQAAVQRLRDAGARLLAGNAAVTEPGVRCAPALLEVAADAFLAQAQALQEEAFGPVALLVRYRDPAQAVAIVQAMDGNLTGSLHTATDGSDDSAGARIVAALRPRVGRLIENQWPTGVAVSPAMQHGGPYPSTSHAGFTAVGMPAAIRRFAQLQCFDQVRDAWLPVELCNANPLAIQRQVDGVWHPHGLD